MHITSIIPVVEQILEGVPLSREQAEFFSSTPHNEMPALLWGADTVRRRYFGDSIVNCSIVNAKCGACSEDCVYCAQSVKYNTGIQNYPLLDQETLVSKALEAAENGSDHFGFVTSGKRLNDADVDVICAVIRDLQKKQVKMEYCLSLGILTDEQLARLKSAGAVRYHHNLETSENHYPKICTTHTWQDRVDTVRNAQKNGLQVCSGALFGLGESWTDRIDLAFALAELNVDSVPLNFLNPIEGTPGTGFDRLHPLDILKIIALFRFVHPKREIKICGGREPNLRDLQSMIFYAGANGFMTGNYLVTKGRAAEDDLQLLEDLSLELENEPHAAAKEC